MSLWLGIISPDTLTIIVGPIDLFSDSVKTVRNFSLALSS